MSKFSSFEEIIAWQKARYLYQKIKPITDIIQSQHDYRLKSQVLASCGSIMDNIAEGFERQGNKEFIQFLYIAKGSCGELRSQLYRILDDGYISEVEFNQLILDILEISRILKGLIQSIDKSDFLGSKYNK